MGNIVCGSRTEPKRELSDYGFEKFQDALSLHLSHESIETLTTIFDFPPAKFDTAKGDKTEFVRVLTEEGIITPNDISTLISALESTEQKNIAVEVQKLFQRNQLGGVQNPKEISSQLKGKYTSLVNALKKRHKRNCCPVEPIQFLPDQWLCVNFIFVESKIEVIDNTKSDEDPGKWSTIKSRHDIFNESAFERCITIEGESGLGKSTLLRQYAHDWYSSYKKSPLRDIDIFIMLNLKKLHNGSSIFDEIRMTLPEDSKLSSQDIEDVITSGHWRVLIALDGYDKNLTDISQILSGRVLTNTILLITTTESCIRELKDKHLYGTKHYTLRGFDHHMQERYIEKFFISKRGAKRDKQLVMGILRENVNLLNICQVPFFFAALVFMIRFGSEDMKLKDINSVTNFFEAMTSWLFWRLEKNMPELDSTSKDDLEMMNKVPKMSKLAFDGFIGSNTKFLWEKAYVIDQLGPEFYNRYVDVGILVEEKHRNHDSQADNELVVTSYVRFLNKIFQEFYAAIHVFRLALTQDAKVVENILFKLSRHDPEYVFQFVCGLQPAASKVIQKYLSYRPVTGKYFSVLCAMEEDERDIDEKVAELCHATFEFCSADDYVNQYMIRLLQRACERNIPISRVSIKDCKKYIHFEEESLFCYPGINLPILDTLQELKICSRFDGCFDLREKARGILDYSGKCAGLRTVTFTSHPLFRSYIILPWHLNYEDCLARLYQNRCKVIWCQGYEKEKWTMNLISGKWENEDGTEMTENDYERVINGEMISDQAIPKIKQSLSAEQRDAIDVSEALGASTIEIDHMILTLWSLQDLPERIAESRRRYLNQTAK